MFPRPITAKFAPSDSAIESLVRSVVYILAIASMQYPNLVDVSLFEVE